MSTIALHGPTTSMALERRGDGTPLWRWWGGRLDDETLPTLADLRAPASFSLDVDQPLAVVDMVRSA